MDYRELIKLLIKLFTRSLGITFYEMVTYKVPYINQNDIYKKPIPNLPEEFSEYNDLLKK